MLRSSAVPFGELSACLPLQSEVYVLSVTIDLYFPLHTYDFYAFSVHQFLLPKAYQVVVMYMQIMTLECASVRAKLFIE